LGLILQESPRKKSIHLYPAEYGPEFVYPQNIGLNVLESIALGVPSLIAQEEFWSCPELVISILVWTTDWTLADAEEKIMKIEKISSEELLREARRLEHVISIENHIIRIISFLE